MKKTFTFRATAAIIFTLVLLVALPVSTAFAIAAGPNNAGTGANQDRGGANAAWTNANNITAPTGVTPYAQVSLGSNTPSDYLRASNYGFAIPAGSTINGITVVINRYMSGASQTVRDDTVQLVNGSGTIVGTNQATATLWPTTLGTATYGGIANMWGTSLTVADINDPDFGVVVAAVRTSGMTARTAYVDYIQITVEYTAGGTNGTTTAVNCGTGGVYQAAGSCVATVTRTGGTLTPSGNVTWASDGTGTFGTSACVQNTTAGTLTCTASYTPTAVGDGTHQVTATYAGDANFTGSSGFQNLPVTGRPLTITATPGQTKVYYDDDPVAFAYTITAGTLFGTDTLTGALTREAGEDVGEYDILIGTLGNPNYAITFVSNVFTITPYAIDVAANPQTKVYGNLDPELTFTFDEALLAPGDDFTGEPTRAPGEDVGEYAITQGTLTLGDNYIINWTDSTLTITARPITVTADPQTKVYGMVDPNFTYQATLVGTDVFTGTLTREPGEDVGAYAILQGTLANPNYTITFVSADLTITPRLISVAADFKAKVYGDPDPALTYILLSGSLVGEDAFSGALTRTAGEDVTGSPYAITQGTLTLGDNYTIAFTGAELAITPRPVTVVADPQTKVFGALDPALTYQVTLVGTDTLNGALTREPGEAIDTYAILQGTLAHPNYTITFIGADFTITGRPVSVAALPQTKVYGELDPALTYTVTSGTLLPGDSFTGELARAAGEDVDTYAITQGTLSLPNTYTLTFTGADFTITQRPVTVTPDPQTKVFGTTDPVFTYTAELVGTDVFTGTLSRLAGENVGTYAITLGTLANPNYSITLAPALLTITKATPTLTVSNSPVTYDGTTKTAQIAVSPTLTGSFSNVLYNGSPSLPVDAGTYAVTANFTPDDTTNYNVLTGAAAGNFIIEKATPTAAVTNSPVFFSGSPKAAELEFSTAGTAVAVYYNGSATVPSAVGTYAVTVDFTPADAANYNSLTAAPAGDFVILPALKIYLPILHK